jgi:hypothetical protein
MTITGAQEPSDIPYVAPITESPGPVRSGGKRPRPNSSQRVDGLGSIWDGVFQINKCSYK